MLTYHIPDQLNEPKYKYLYNQLKKDIVCGTLKAGERLPSKRSFAEHNGVSVITVENAYQLLCDEGYLVPRQRSGYFVAELMPLFRSAHPSDRSSGEAKTPSLSVQSKIPPVVSAIAGNHAARTDDPAKGATLTTTQPSLPTPSLSERYFPLSEYRKVMRNVLSANDDCLTRKSPAFGCDVLRGALADYLLRYRGIQVSPEQLIIGSGSAHLYNLITMFLGREGIYGLEDPSYEKIRQVYEANGARCEMLPMDATGISSAALAHSRASFLHVTPFHSYPTGISASAGKRIEYLNWAYARGGIIIEDDVDSEYAVSSHPAEAIFSLDQQGCVIYMNTFSRSMTPAVRVAYLVLPERLVEPFTQKLSFHSCTVPTFDQYVLAQFIAQGYYERHLNRLRRRLRYDAL